MQAIILAAGKGTRMGDLNGSPLPKVMYSLNGIPLIKYSVENVQKAGVRDIVVVVGYQNEKVQTFLGSSVRYAVQEQQLGTGHAVMVAKSFFPEGLEGVLVCYGDMPLYKPETVRKLIKEYEAKKPVMAMLTVKFERPDDWAYGRIIRNHIGEITSIVEQKDCTSEQKR
ncbi:MAG: NTP transferase domain-containing protein, partial [Nanoarchaeota archaeon]